MSRRTLGFSSSLEEAPPQLLIFTVIQVDAAEATFLFPGVVAFCCVGSIKLQLSAGDSLINCSE